MEMEDGSYLRLNYNEYYLVLIQKANLHFHCKLAFLLPNSIYLKFRNIYRLGSYNKPNYIPNENL